MVPVHIIKIGHTKSIGLCRLCLSEPDSSTVGHRISCYNIVITPAIIHNSAFSRLGLDIVIHDDVAFRHTGIDYEQIPFLRRIQPFLIQNQFIAERYFNCASLAHTLAGYQKDVRTNQRRAFGPRYRIRSR